MIGFIVFIMWICSLVTAIYGILGSFKSKRNSDEEIWYDTIWSSSCIFLAMNPLVGVLSTLLHILVGLWIGYGTCCKVGRRLGITSQVTEHWTPISREWSKILREQWKLFKERMPL